MRKAIIVLRKLEDFEIQDIYERHSSGEIDLFANPENAEFFKNKCKVIELASEDKRKINYDILDRILEFGDKEIKGKSISQHLAFSKNASIWYYHKFRIYFLIRNKHYDIDLIKTILVQYDQLEAYCSHSLDLYFDDKVSFHKPLGKVKKDYLSLYNYALFFGLRVLSGFFAISKKEINHLVIDRGELQAVLNRDLSIQPGNYNLEYLFQKLDGKFTMLHEVEIPKAQKGNRFKIKYSFFKKRNKNVGLLFGESVMFFGLLSGKLMKQRKRLSAQIYGKYKLLQDFAANDFESDVVSEFRNLHKTSSYYIFKYLCYERLFHKNAFKTITSIDENSPGVKTIFDAAKSCGVKTIGIQHGNIYDLLISYRYTKLDARNKTMADKTLVWGSNFKNFLCSESNFPPQSVDVVGQIRTDIIKSIQDKKQLLANPETKGYKKIIQFASQPQPDAKIRYQSAYDVLLAVKDLVDVLLIVKLHPGEKNDFEYYHSIAKSAKCKNYILLLDIDLYVLLTKSDIVITCYSTVGSEAVYFNKPLIIIDYLKQDLLEYIQKGVAFPAYSQLGVSETIRKLLIGELSLNKFAYKEFINDFAFKIDGRVVTRVLENIKN